MAVVYRPAPTVAQPQSSSGDSPHRTWTVNSNRPPACGSRDGCRTTGSRPGWVTTTEGSSPGGQSTCCEYEPSPLSTRSPVAWQPGGVETVKPEPAPGPTWLPYLSCGTNVTTDPLP